MTAARFTTRDTFIANTNPRHIRSTLHIDDPFNAIRGISPIPIMAIILRTEIVLTFLVITQDNQ